MTDGTTVGLVVSLTLNFIGTILAAQSSETCPQFCVCDTWYMLERVSCTGCHLYNIDTGAPNSVEALDLSDNVISLINNFDLANAGLTRLKYLNLSGNTISEIGLNAFDNLDNLSVLDLSKNHLYYILDDVFAQNKNLRILKLSRNHFNSYLPKLRSSWLTELSLDSCQISHLPADTFIGLKQIQRLDLSNNLMIQMSSQVVSTLYFLKKLNIEGNPWSCNKIMYDLQIYLTDKQIEFDEVCIKKTNPKKFEKMILPPKKKQQDYHHWTIKNTTIQETELVTKNNFSNPNNTNLSTYEKTENQKHSFAFFWFLGIGFICGAACGMVISYIWLSGRCICTRHWHQEHNDAFQRFSLLSNSYLHNSIDSTVLLTESCPNTPPPSYRDVVLQPSLYRCLSRHSNFSNNTTEYRERNT
ncbi:uncharacterized protein LOC143143268 isoform X1 [Ptiloglossa arizonensis]|uniref:uncharacterized protein LOC143143268 isoform X1 n=1 Tax=Ptiloglossa arizonensis TaxID=3350558 RepID=UPI003FA06245